MLATSASAPAASSWPAASAVSAAWAAAVAGRVEVDPGAVGQVELIAAEGGGDELLTGAARNRLE
jgi:hypothetical protein